MYHHNYYENKFDFKMKIIVVIKQPHHSPFLTRSSKGKTNVIKLLSGSYTWVKHEFKMIINRVGYIMDEWIHVCVGILNVAFLACLSRDFWSCQLNLATKSTINYFIIHVSFDYCFMIYISLVVYGNFFLSLR